MTEIIRHQKDAVDELCRRYDVKRLDLFGSAADGRFDPRRSDLDFLVDFLPLEPGKHSKAYFGLWFALEDLFGRKVDLVETPAVDNPYFLESIRPTRRVLYAA